MLTFVTRRKCSRSSQRSGDRLGGLYGRRCRCAERSFQASTTSRHLQHLIPFLAPICKKNVRTALLLLATYPTSVKYGGVDPRQRGNGTTHEETNFGVRLWNTPSKTRQSKIWNSFLLPSPIPAFSFFGTTSIFNPITATVVNFAPPTISHFVTVHLTLLHRKPPTRIFQRADPGDLL